MTDAEIRAVFDELRRVGADLERPPGLALGTGFRGGEFLTWLQALPDALGHGAFIERLNAHLAEAAPLPASAELAATAPGHSPPFYTCATLEQLEAATDVLVEEWDPLGARDAEPLDTLDFVRASLGPNEGDMTTDRQRHLQRLARGLLEQKPRMYGPMAPEIDAFVQQYAPPPA